MTPTEAAIARHRLYALLGRLLVDGPRPESLALARAVPALAAVMPSPDASGAVLDDLAAEHYAATSEAPTAESALLGDDGLIGGPLTDAVRSAYAAGGFHPGRSDVPLDDLGLELAYLGHLSAAEAEARADDAPGLDRLLQLQAAFLDEHLLAWLPAWTVAAGRDAPAPWRTVAELALELAASHRSALPLPATPPWIEPPPPPDLDHPDTGLGDIASWLALPARSGWIPTRAALVRVTAAAGVPAGVLERSRALGQAMRASADLGRLDALLDALLAELDTHDTALVAVGEALSVPVAAWRARIAQSRRILLRIRGEVR